MPLSLHRITGTRTRRTTTLVALVGLLLALVASPALADDVIATVTIVGRPMTVSTLSGADFVVTDRGADLPIAATTAIEVVNPHGSGNSWSIQIASEALAPGAIATGEEIVVTGIVSTCAAEPCTRPVNRVNYPLSIPQIGADGTSERLFGAEEDTGMGAFVISPTFEVHTPAGRQAVTSPHIITVTTVAGF